MKQYLIVALALLVTLAVSSLAQDKAADAPLKSLKGTIKADGDKYTFVSDKDKKSWDVMNPEALKGHEGHHVELKAHVYAGNSEIRVMSVKMMVGPGTGKCPPCDDDKMK